MNDLALQPTGKIRRPDLFEPTTALVQRNLRVGVAARRPDTVVAMVSRARARGVSYRRIVEWLGPRASCPAELMAVRERIELLAGIEG